MVTYVAPVLPHVHLRWNEKRASAHFLKLGYRDARAVGASVVMEMPNTKPALTTNESTDARYNFIEDCQGELGHRIHIGLTNDSAQVREAFVRAKNGVGENNSVKVYWVNSTGDMGILDHNVQRRIWNIASEVDFRGPVLQHCEDELYFQTPFDFKNPVSHSARQLEVAELAQVDRQMKNAFDAEFNGTFYVCHVSSPATIDFINSQRAKMPFKMVIETIGNHEFLNWKDYEIHGNRAKRNPPLRHEESQRKLLERVLDGKTDILGDDHAPHYLDEKDSDKPMSGDPAIAFLPKRVEMLLSLGMRRGHLDSLLFHKANELFFGRKLTPRTVEIEYRPELWDAYGWNPFSRVDGTHRK